MTQKDFELSEYLPYLVRRLGPEIAQAHEEILTAENLTSDMFRCLWALYSDGPQNLNALSIRTAIHLSTLSRLIGRMDTLKLLRRRRAGRDARAVQIELLPAGRQKCRRLIPWSLKKQRLFLAGFEKAEEELFRDFLRRLYDNILKINRS